MTETRLVQFVIDGPNAGRFALHLVASGHSATIDSVEAATLEDATEALARRLGEAMCQAGKNELKGT